MKSGTLHKGDRVDALVDPWWRREIRRHHSVTHLLQRALKDVAGEGVAQRGSAVFPDRTRFDFDSPVGALAKDQRAQVAARVNELIRADYHVSVAEMPFREAVDGGAVYMRGEKYGDVVRVVRFGPSIELCGGTHVESTGEIGHFVLLSESAIGAGIRRVEGLVSEAADAFDTRIREAAEEAGAVVTATVEQLPDAVLRLSRERKELEKRIGALQAQIASARAAEYAANARSVDGVPYVSVLLTGDEGISARELSDSIRAHWRDGVVVVGGPSNGKAALVVSASGEVAGRRVNARALFDALAPRIEAKGGGNAAMAQGAGKNVTGLPALIEAVPDAIRAVLHG